MADMRSISRRDTERLSAYLDGELGERATARLELRLQREPELRQALEELQAAVWLLRALPEVRPPRHFTLTPEMAGRRSTRPVYPILQLATAIATFAFVALLGVDLLMGSTARFALAPSETGQLAAEAPLAVTSAEDQALADEALEAQDGFYAEPALEEQAPEAEMRAAGAETDEGVSATQPPEEPAAEAEALEFSAEVPAPAEPDAADEAGKVSGETDTLEAADPELGTPTPEAQPSGENLVTPAAPAGELTEAPPIARRPPPALRMIEVALGALALMLGVMTIWMRRRT